MRDLVRFARAVGREWRALLTGGTLIAVLFLVERAGAVAVPRWVLIGIAGLAFLAAVFRTWRAEWLGRLAAEQRLKDLENALQQEEALAIQISDEEFWLLTRVARHGLRRQHDIQGSLLWLDEKPISYDESRWFYDLVDVALKHGHLKLDFQDGRIHLPSTDARRAIEVGTKKDRRAAQPKILVDANTGETIRGI